MGKPTLNQITERHVVGKRTDGAVVQRVVWPSRSKYKPHQSKREIARRMISPSALVVSRAAHGTK